MNDGRLSVEGFCHEPSHTVTYLVWDEASRTLFNPLVRALDLVQPQLTGATCKRIS